MFKLLRLNNGLFQVFFFREREQRKNSEREKLQLVTWNKRVKDFTQICLDFDGANTEK